MSATSGQKLKRAARPLFWAGTLLSCLLGILLLAASFDFRSAALRIGSAAAFTAGPVLSLGAAAAVYFLGERIKD